VSFESSNSFGFDRPYFLISTHLLFFVGDELQNFFGVSGRSDSVRKVRNAFQWEVIRSFVSFNF
jgi:hypothetical protein